MKRSWLVDLSYGPWVSIPFIWLALTLGWVLTIKSFYATVTKVRTNDKFVMTFVTEALPTYLTHIYYS